MVSYIQYMSFHIFLYYYYYRHRHHQIKFVFLQFCSFILPVQPSLFAIFNISQAQMPRSRIRLCSLCAAARANYLASFFLKNIMAVLALFFIETILVSLYI